jgi:hypothetical protein
MRREIVLYSWGDQAHNLGAFQMTNVNITTPTTFSTIATLRVAAIDAETSNYGARCAYAGGLNGIADCAWFDLEGNGGKLPEAIASEKKAYYEGLKAIGYSNPSNAWKMVKQYAKADAIARALFGVVAEAEPETEAGNKARPLDLRLVEELTALYKACSKVDALSKKQLGAFDGIKAALKSMGVDISLINEGK